MKKFYLYIENILIFLLLTICSYQGVFFKINSYLDEFILFIIIMYEFIIHFFIKKEKIKLKYMLIFIIFISVTLINLIIKSYSEKAYFQEVFNFLKPIILLETLSLININEKRHNLFLKMFILINFISIIYGIFYYLFYDSIGYTIGDKFRNGKIRIEGFSGHPISLGFASLMIIVFVNEIKKNRIIEKIIYFFIVILTFWALILTQDRLPLALLFVYIIFYLILFLKKFSSRKKEILFVIIIIMIGLISILGIFFFNRIKDYLSEDIENTIRMYAWQKAFEIFKVYPFLGTGIGTFGCTASIKYNSYVYNIFNFNRFTNLVNSSTGNVFESYFAKVLIETGLFGIFFYSYFFLKYFKISIKNKSRQLFFLVLCIIILSTLNNMYQIPFIIGIAIEISYNNFLLKTSNDRRKK